MTERADVIVVGMGPGGEDVAERLAEAGLDVVGIEAELVGGECPYWGCVPSKMMIRAADLLAEAPPDPRDGGRRRPSRPTGRRWPGASGDEATDYWDDTVAVERFEARAAASSGAGDASTGPTGWWWATGSSRRPGPWSSRRHTGLDPAGGRAGRHALLDQPRGHRGRGGPGLAGRARRRGDRRRAGPGLRALRRRR